MTYSIVARDLVSEEMGVAVQSHWFSVGPIVPWAQPGVGAIATQANAEVSYGPRGLELLAGGMGAAETLGRLVAADELSASRQVAIVDHTGAVAAHTGTGCMAMAGDVQGNGVSCQANIMAAATVWPAMLAAYSATPGPLAGRLLAALRAAEGEGGDLRGRQSAAILVVPAAGDRWETVVDLRVEDHPQPLDELDRLMRLHDAYRVASDGDAQAAGGDHDAAARLYRRAAELAPESDELRFWAGLGAAQAGDLSCGVDDVRAAIAINAGWRELLGRLSAEQAPSAAAVLAAL